MSMEYWNWLDLELKIPEFAIFRAFNGADLIRLFVKIKEGISEREELNYGWNWKAFGEFYQDLTNFNEKVEKVKDLNSGEKALRYSSGSNRIQVTFYFSKENWTLFYAFMRKVYLLFSEQRQEFEQKFKKGD